MDDEVVLKDRSSGDLLISQSRNRYNLPDNSYFEGRGYDVVYQEEYDPGAMAGVKAGFIAGFSLSAIGVAAEVVAADIPTASALLLGGLATIGSLFVGETIAAYGPAGNLDSLGYKIAG